MSQPSPTHDPYGNPLPPQQLVKDPPKWMKDMFSAGVTDVINTDMFKDLDKFVQDYAHFGPTGPVTTLNVLLPLKGYSEKAFTWLKNNGTNFIEIDGRLAIAAKLKVWIGAQTSPPLMSYLPSFRHLKIDGTQSNAYAQQVSNATKQSVAWSGNRIFAHNGFPFNIYKATTHPNCDTGWGSTQVGDDSSTVSKPYTPLRAVSPRPMDDGELREFTEKVGGWEPDYWGSDHAFIGWSGF